MKTLPYPSKLTYVGPDIEEGPRPSFFYFALSAADSLLTPPYNQPISFLQDAPIRIFSISLPEHGEGKPPQQALGRWAEAFEKGEDLLTPFFDSAAGEIEELFKRGLILPHLIALGGLSRGSFIACHIASRFSEIPYILGFAPLTELTFCSEFSHIRDRELVKKLDLVQLAEKLYNKALRFYIGNHDLRVGTDRCFSFVTHLAHRAFEKKIRTSPIELVMGSSIGFQGHGTSPEVFQAGAEWIRSRLLHETL